MVYWEVLPEKATINATRYHANLDKSSVELIKKDMHRDKKYTLSMAKVNQVWLEGAAPPTIFTRLSTFCLRFTSLLKQSFKGRNF